MKIEENKYWRAFTKEFIDVKPVLIDHQEAQKAMRKADRKLKSVMARYAFVKDVVGINSNDTVLSNAIKLLLKNAGFEKVVHFQSQRIKPKREDIQAWDGNEVFIIEVKGIRKINPQNELLMQVLRYLKENQKRMEGKKVYGLSIINHDNEKHISQRQQTFRDSERENDAKNCGYGFMSTYDLLIGFHKLKSGNITFEDFKASLRQTGLITYDSKGGKTSKK